MNNKKRKYFKQFTAFLLTLFMLLPPLLPVFAENYIGDTINGTLSTGLPQNTTFLLKNVGTGQYLTFLDYNSNMIVSNFDSARQSLELVKEDNHYKIKHSISDYAAFIIDIDGQWIYHMWTIDSSDHYGADWLFYKTGNDENGNAVFRIARDNIQNYVMTAYQFSGTGLTYATIAPNDNSNSNQEWVLEGFDNISEVIPITGDLEDIYTQFESGKKIKFVPSYSVTGYSSSDTNIAQVDSNGIVTITDIGRVEIYGTDTLGNPFSYYIYVQPSNGTYFINNVRYGLMLGFGDNMYPINGDSNQKWQLVHAEDKYYFIINSEGKYLSIEQGVELLDYSVGIRDYQLWTLEPTSSNNFKISPKFNDNAALTHFVTNPGDINEVNYVELATYVPNAYYNDEWSIFEKADTIVLYDITTPEALRNSFKISLPNIPGNVCMNEFYSFQKSQIISLMQSTETIFIFTHGEKNHIQIASNLNLTSSDIANVDLSNLKLVVLLSCSCADGGYNANRVPTNFVETLIACGVETVVGFDTLIQKDNANDFAVSFVNEYFVNKKTLSNSATTAASIHIETRDHLVIGGNLNLEINKGETHEG